MSYLVGPYGTPRFRALTRQKSPPARGAGAFAVRGGRAILPAKGILSIVFYAVSVYNVIVIFRQEYRPMSNNAVIG